MKPDFSSVGRAYDCSSCGRWFESSKSDKKEKQNKTTDNKKERLFIIYFWFFIFIEKRKGTARKNMCWNSEVSLNTFAFSTFVLGMIIYNNAYTQYKIPELNNIWVYLLLFSVISMQLVEFFVWRNIDNKYYNHLLH